MKFLEKIQQVMQKSPKVEPEIFLSLILDESYIQAGAWNFDGSKKPRLLFSTSERAASPTWDDRIRMADHAIGKLEEETGSTKLTKVVLGLGERFLTNDGEIEKSVRSQLKLLTKSLELIPLGFVPLSASIAHYLRKTEGIPTSVILISVTEENFDISIYRVGRLAFATSVKKTESEGEDIEHGLKACTDADVLPSRILLYGADDIKIQETQAVLLKHQWTARANFLHYPKIDVFPFELMIHTVVEAGANEMTSDLQEEAHEEPSSAVVDEMQGDDLMKEEKQEEQGNKQGVLVEEPEAVSPEEKEKETEEMVIVQPEVMGFHESDTRSGEKTKEEREENPLEFDDVQKENLLGRRESGTEKEEIPIDRLHESKSKIPSIKIPAGFRQSARVGKNIVRKIPKKIVAIGFVILAVIAFGIIVLTRILPRVTVTLAVLPQTVTREDTITIDPQSAVIDGAKKIIPAKKLEKTVTGEKAVAATGKKKIGDPAKGAVILYNKSEDNAYTLKKGTILTTGSLQFALDSDVSIASSSMSLSGDQLTFGKATGTVTAVTVGTEGNVEAGKEFSIKEHATSILVARNEKAFTGGTSKEVTVVSRADTDALLKSLTADLVEKAKTELTQSVSGKERMIEQTIKTAVKDKQFMEEIDEETKDLHGTLSISVSAYTYNEEDIKILLSGIAQGDVPVGYSVNQGRTSVAIGNMTVAKNGVMTARATLNLGALPSIDEEKMKKTIAGKKLVDVQSELKLIPGVASAEFLFRSSWKKDVLPTDPNHITLTVVTLE